MAVLYHLLIGQLWDRAARERRSLPAGDLPEIVVWGHHTEGEASRQKGNWGRCLGNFMQQQGGESMRQRAPKVSSILGSSVAMGFILRMASSCYVQFHEAGKAGRL